MAFPRIVSQAEFDQAHDALLVKEKAATHALAAERRRQPVVAVRNDYAFATPNGDVTFVDLFEGRQQLIVYHFMGTTPDDDPCGGCCSMTGRTLMMEMRFPILSTSTPATRPTPWSRGTRSRSSRR